MNLPELLKNIPKTPFHQQDAINLAHFLKANTSKVEHYQVNDWNGDTYVIIKWPYKVQGLVVLP